ncbi:hypothetical protein CANARDRAFT_27060 [[Candida] arabinofermentans NRRL YB-2248]|uniref:histone deacetylase n=1 Tax=[Candida] arabinofermentans NRRL YB-2248 TaxID=983967 RepID=A0A1E4T4I4_9ASCO|nr:hypothetical protein CANARDRAFT_27060 [[Candida] arabinofermentans NRRL YB-2248]
MSNEINDEVFNIGIVNLSEHDSLIIDLLPSNENRSTILHQLLKGYGLYNPLSSESESFERVKYDYATLVQLLNFHDSGYLVELLKERNWDNYTNDLSKHQSKILDKLKLKKNQIASDRQALSSCSSLEFDADNDDDNDDDDDDSRLEKYGLLHDCPIFPFLPQYVNLTAGTTISATEWLMNQSKDKQNIAINWTGGRHHARKSKASGFCYVNDITLGILNMRRRYKKVGYLDLDLHHGDGVSGSFKFSDRVLTISLHFCDVGFFPGSGVELGDGGGLGKGKGFDWNIPLKKGFSDSSLDWILSNVVLPKLTQFGCDSIVVQCGGDGLCSDTAYSEWNLTIKGYGLAVFKFVKTLKVDCLLLGGGGYNNLETAKLWTFITGLFVNGAEKSLGWNLMPDNIDDEIVNFGEFEFWANDQPSNMQDRNDIEYLNLVSNKFNLS